MLFYLTLGLSALIFLALPIMMKSNAVISFFALCTGKVVSDLAGPDVLSLTKSFIPNSNLPLESIVKIALLLIPALLSIFFLKHSVQKVRLFVHVPVSLCAAILTVILSVQSYPETARQTIENTSIYKLFDATIVSTVIFGLVFSLVLLFFERNKDAHGHGHHKGHHKL